MERVRELHDLHISIVLRDSAVSRTKHRNRVFSCYDTEIGFAVAEESMLRRQEQSSSVVRRQQQSATGEHRKRTETNEGRIEANPYSRGLQTCLYKKLVDKLDDEFAAFSLQR